MSTQPEQDDFSPEVEFAQQLSQGAGQGLHEVEATTGAETTAAAPKPRAATRKQPKREGNEAEPLGSPAQQEQVAPHPRENEWGLNERQTLFVRHYLATRNGTASAKSAGYSSTNAASTACELLRNKRVAPIVAAETQRDATDTQTTARWIRDRLRREATNKDPRAAGARVRALELLAKLNGDFAEDNAQKAGFLSDLPSHVLDSIRARLNTEAEADGGYRH